ncbi:hypothetical protein D9M70_541490 [compost metagenome]
MQRLRQPAGALDGVFGMGCGFRLLHAREAFRELLALGLCHRRLDGVAGEMLEIALGRRFEIAGHVEIEGRGKQRSIGLMLTVLRHYKNVIALAKWHGVTT